MSDEWAAMDATAQAELVARGEVTPLELVDAAIARIEAVDPKLNAVVHRAHCNQLGPSTRKIREPRSRGDGPRVPFGGSPAADAAA